MVFERRPRAYLHYTNSRTRHVLSHEKLNLVKHF
jgi:hypothetical protein